MVHINSKYAVKAFLSIILFSVLSLTISAQQYGSITIDTGKNILPVSRYINGGFVEQIYDAINGVYGLGAQELFNRGFDIGSQYDETSRGWQTFTSGPSVGRLFLDTLGYNRRGRYAQHIVHSESAGRIGVLQPVYIEREVPMDFYVYARSVNAPAALKLVLYHIDSTIAYDTTLDITSKEWKKFSLRLPTKTGFPKALLFIGLDTTSTVEIDEASFMASDNFHGIRRAQFELYKAWRPTILRFPGGGVVDLEPGRWEHGIGDIDQRTSPNFDWVGDYYRFEIGTDEFVAFCKAVGAEPQFTVGFGAGSPSEAANYLQYCNAPTGSPYSDLRMKNGNREPFNVKFWEIGNEQYGPWENGHTNAVDYATRYLEYAKQMRAVDPTIKLMINGDTWGFNWNDTIIRIAAKEIDYFSVHWLSINSDTTNNRDLTHRVMMSNGNMASFWSPILHDKIVESGLSKDIPLAYTECVQFYADPHNYMIPIAGSLESGLWVGNVLHSFYKQADIVKLVNKTMFLGSIRAGIHSKTGERVFFAGPSIHAQSMIRNWMRDTLQPVTVTSPRFSVEGRDNIPWLDAAATFGNDTLVLSVVNAHSTDSITVQLSLPLRWGSMAEAVQLTAAADTSINTPEHPSAVTPVYYSVRLDSQMVFPAHSHTIIRAPRYDTPNTVDNTAIMNNDQLAASRSNPSFNILLLPRQSTRCVMTIYDTKGKIVESRTVDIPTKATNYILDLQNVAVGMYVCIMKFEDKEYRKSLLITP